MANLFWLAVLILILAGEPGSVGQPKQAGPESTPAGLGGTLACDQGVLTYLADGQEPINWPAGGAVPYRVVVSQTPAVVTTCSSSLRVTTYALADTVHEYQDLVPLIIAPPLRVLTSPYDNKFYTAGALVFLDDAGAAAWQLDEGELLLPGAGELETSVAYAVTAAGSTPLMPYGDVPELIALDPATGNIHWRATLGDFGSPAGVRLVALTEAWGLLSLQYDYTIFEYLRFDRESGELGPSFMLAGQPLVEIIFPGQVDRYFSCEVDGEIVSLAVSEMDSGYRMWNFDLAAGVLDQTPLEPPDRYYVEENELPVGGAGTPGPHDSPFPQSLLPTAGGDSWQIEALVDSQGHVLVIDDTGARWFDPGGSR